MNAIFNDFPAPEARLKSEKARRVVFLHVDDSDSSADFRDLAENSHKRPIERPNNPSYAFDPHSQPNLVS